MDQVVVVGSINRDVVVTVPELPVPGETVLGSNHFFAPGGKGANQAVAARRLGAAVTLVGRVGADEAGAELTRTLAREGVDVGHVSVDPDLPTGHAFILVDSRGANMIALSAGANMALPPDTVAALASAAAVTCVQLEIPDATVSAAVRAGSFVILNAAPAKPLQGGLLERVSVLVVNEVEAATLAGTAAPESIDDAVAAAAAIPGPRHTVVTLGADGAGLITEGRLIRWTPPPVAVVDTTGAGDALCGTLAARIAAGDTVEAALAWGVAAGAAAVTKKGAIPSLPDSAMVAELLDSVERHEEALRGKRP